MWMHYLMQMFPLNSLRTKVVGRVNIMEWKNRIEQHTWPACPADERAIRGLQGKIVYSLSRRTYRFHSGCSHWNMSWTRSSDNWTRCSDYFDMCRCLDERADPPLARSCSRGPQSGRMPPGYYTGSPQLEEHPRRLRLSRVRGAWLAPRRQALPSRRGIHGWTGQRVTRLTFDSFIGAVE
ncbi:hypothetical protein CFC21_034697 [Triticum aestivum]|uniref:Uncharacterized protein n=3 Tax=Triticum TaxID=4564 RepID=A0A9R1JLE4_WHEAT|nr:hypothetical protein CFC21_034694 [Triticum aestivum]KAF7021806.1 hypothetical protein CFC21_034697 [Triticum aestivum]VAH59027.1 unnamed protein product [Triticum turgidum subsp. durum]